ncbi:hypothetical protein [Nocardia jiangxiensis]|uniref:hypothetical protein n=1 Tax=Nocardia jiangxiensis TaxID=282685 RepID=UPI0012F6B485|nr:hypothetical protein [Nocardia jiangxiensis]
MSFTPEILPADTSRFPDHSSRTALRKAIRRLPVQLNIVMTKVFLDEIPIDRVASSLGIEVDIAVARLDEGLQALRTPYLQRLLNAERPKRRVFRPNACNFCGKGFRLPLSLKPGRPKQYCSDLCRQRAHRARKRTRGLAPD